MIPVDEAIDLIKGNVRPLEPLACPLINAAGLTLAEDVLSGTDSPPFDKSLMDGFAVRSADCESPGSVLRIVEDVMAGSSPEHSIGQGQCTRIMTGAPIPDGADAVVPVEHTEAESAGVRIRTRVATEANLLRQGAAMRCGDHVLRSGSGLRAQEIGLLAEIGCHTVAVRPAPRVAILATGDELVAAGEAPGPGQIRNSNEPMLAAQIQAMGGQAVPLGIAQDNAEHIDLGIDLGLNADALILSGGVSAGQLDLVPDALRRAGVERIFHKVAVKPGKPIWFGIGHADGRVVPVFGLPGNPVSSLVCCELFVREAISMLVGATGGPLELNLPVAESIPGNPDRPTYRSGCIEPAGEQGSTVRPVAWVGSADLRSTAGTNVLILVPAGTDLQPGAFARVRLLQV